MAEKEIPEEQKSASFLPYPVSTLSPVIVPNDLTTFKSRGVSQVEKTLQTKLNELRREYEAALDDFHWNKLVYEAEFGFEPIVGETYHLYEMASGFRHSMIPPEQWRSKKWVGTFRLNLDRKWEPQELSESFDLRGLAGEEEVGARAV